MKSLAIGILLFASAPSRAEDGPFPRSLQGTVPSITKDGDGGTHITFKGAFNTERIEIPSGAGPGESIWDSGESDPLNEAFTAVIFHGRSSDAGISIEGSKKEGSQWGPWLSAEVERFPNGRFWGTLPLSGRSGDSVKLRIVNRGIPVPGSIRLYEIEAVTPAKETFRAQAETQGPPAPPIGNAPKPRVHPRKQWEAAPPKSPYEPMIPVRITVHHTEGAQPMTLKDAIQEMQVIQSFHQKGRGWIDIGYHFLIDGSGRVFQGRPETVIGAHVRNKNEGNVGISLMGAFQKPENQQPTRAQIRSLIRLARWLGSRYSIDPQTIKGHRDQMDTSCPGENLYVKLDAIRKAVAEPQPPAPIVAPPAVKIPTLPAAGTLFDFGMRFK